MPCFKESSPNLDNTSKTVHNTRSVLQANLHLLNTSFFFPQIGEETKSVEKV